MENGVKTNLLVQIDELNKKKARLEAQRDMLNNQLGELDSQIKAKGYDPEKLPDYIRKFTADIEEFEKMAGPIVEQITRNLEQVSNSEHTVSEFKGFE